MPYVGSLRRSNAKGPSEKWAEEEREGRKDEAGRLFKGSAFSLLSSSLTSCPISRQRLKRQEGGREGGSSLLLLLLLLLLRVVRETPRQVAALFRAPGNME